MVFIDTLFVALPLLLSCIISVGLVRRKNMWLFITLYWITQALKGCYALLF